MNTATDQHVTSLFRQAEEAYATGKTHLAESGARAVIELDPYHAGACYLLGAIRLDAGDALNALPLLENALRLSPNHPGILLALGNAHFALERWREAVHLYELWSSAGNSSGRIILNTAISLHKLKETGKAVELLRKGTELYPQDHTLWNAYGDLLNKENEDLASIDAHERAVSLMPDNPDYVANLALMYEQSNRMEDAERIAGAMLGKYPTHPLLLLICARCQRRRKSYRNALDLLAQIPATSDIRYVRASRFEAGRIHDFLKETEQAFDCFTEGNQLTFEVWPSHRNDAAAFIDNWRSIHAYLTSRDSLPWPEFPAEDAARPRHAFLFGFMRSGTTLMDTILETDPRITVLEEEQPIHRVIRIAESMSVTYPACLETLTVEQVSTLREIYWQGVAELIGPLEPHRLVLDKQPMLGPHIGLSRILFPEARFIFALRHPCDVILSNFMQPFGHKPFHANFTTLEGSAAVYTLVMDLWLSYQRLLNIEAHVLRYEALIHDKQRVLHEVFGYLGLDDAQTDADHVAHAKRRGRIYTPSYHQVVQPLYTDAMERWRRYRRHFEAIMPILQPYIERFGYSV